MRERLWKEWRFYQPYLSSIGALLMAGLYIGVLMDATSPRSHFPDILRNVLMIASWPLLGALSFGHECSYGTMQLLLSQGITRRRIWYEKLLVLGFAITLLMIIYWLSFWAGERFKNADLIWLFLAGPFLAFSTGPLFALLLRNTLAAILLIAITPLLIALLVDFLVWEEWLDTRLMHICAQTAYGAIAYLLGCFLFKRYQDYDRWWSSLNLSLHWPMDQLSNLFKRAFRWRWGYRYLNHPFLSLTTKELHLQQMVFLLGLMEVAVFMLWHYSRMWSDRQLEDRFTFYALAWLFCIVNTILSGVLAFAEEKHWGVADWQFTLPVSAGHQWAIKIATSYAVSFFLGAVLPALLYQFILWKMPGNDPDLRPWYMVGSAMVLFSLMATSISLLASSLSKNTTQAAMLAVLMLGLSLWICRSIGSLPEGPVSGIVWSDMFPPSLIMMFLGCWLGVAVAHYNIYGKRMHTWTDTTWLVPACILLGSILCIGMWAVFGLLFLAMTSA